jgi:CheY-like chemotaxis protein
LIVDDEPAARYALMRVFQSAFEVFEAGSVVEARGKLGERPEVILLDYSLPGEDGMALLREVGADPDAAGC